jgi:hypothetical protein
VLFALLETLFLFIFIVHTDKLYADVHKLQKNNNLEIKREKIEKRE